MKKRMTFIAFMLLLLMQGCSKEKNPITPEPDHSPIFIDSSAISPSALAKYPARFTSNKDYFSNIHISSVIHGNVQPSIDSNDLNGINTQPSVAISVSAR